MKNKVLTLGEIDVLRKKTLMSQHIVRKTAVQSFCFLICIIVGLQFIELNKNLIQFSIGVLAFLFGLTLLAAVFLEFRLNQFLQALNPISTEEFNKLLQIKQYPEITNYLDTVSQLKSKFNSI
jgi:hypothetical protein